MKKRRRRRGRSKLNGLLTEKFAMNKSQKRGFVRVIGLIIVLALLVGGGYWYWQRNLIIPDKSEPTDGSLPAGEAGPTSISDTISEPVTPLAPTPITATHQELWSIIERMKTALSGHDLETVKRLGYKPFPPCTDTATCNQLMDFLSAQIKDLRLVDYANQWINDRQAVFTTAVKIAPGTQPNYQTASYSKIFFIKDPVSRIWKLLQVASSDSFSDTNKAEVEKAMADSDQDGITDRREACLGASAYDSRCQKTDPTKRDTNGNGWWDSIEYEMNL